MPSQPRQELGAGSVQQVVFVQRLGHIVGKREGGRRRPRLGDGDGMVERRDRRGCHPTEGCVERGDLSPVGGVRGERLAVDGGDRGLDLVAPGPVPGQRRLQQLAALGDRLPVPAGTVLDGQGSQLPVGGLTLLPAAVGQQQQGEQPTGLRLIRHQPQHHPGQPDRLVAQRVPHHVASRSGQVALVEDQVDHRQHRGESLRQQGLRRHPDGDAGGADLVLGAHQALRHRRFLDQKGPGDLGGGETADQTKRQRHPGLGRERRVAAGEEQSQPVVADGGRIQWRGGVVLVIDVQSQRGLTGRGTGALATQMVERLVAGGGHQPGAGAVGGAIARPAFEGGRQRLLNRVLGEVDVAEEPGQGRDDASGLVAKDAGQRRLSGGLGEGAGDRVSARQGGGSPESHPSGGAPPWRSRSPRRGRRNR